MKIDLSVKNILTASIFALAVYMLTEPFKRFLDEKLERKTLV